MESFTIKPVTRQDEVYAVAFIVGEQVSLKAVEDDAPVACEVPSQKLAEQAMQNPRFNFFAAYRENGAALGYICGEIRPSLYVDGQVDSYELLWVVADQYRKWGVGLALLDTWEKFCKQQGCKHVYMGLSAHTQPEKLRRIYSMLGYKLHSESYSKTL